jgi:hypothetical protein
VFGTTPFSVEATYHSNKWLGNAQKDIAREAKLGQHSTHRKVDWCAFCRDLREQYLIDNPQIIRGLNDDMASKVVETLHRILLCNTS